MQFARALISRATRNSGERGDWEEGTPFEVGIPLVHGVAVCVKGSSREGPFDLEWQDERSPPVAPDGITGSVTVPTVTGLVAKFHSIVFGDNQLSSQQPLVLHFQMKHDRFAMRRVTLSVDSKGQLTNFTVKDGAGKEPISFSHARALMVTLQDMCSGDDAFGLVRPPMWADLPSELWWHVVKGMTQRQGRAVSCSCKTIAQIVKLPSFIWVHEPIHLDIVQAAEAVRTDKRTNLPLNIVEGEVLVGRSRNNNVVLLRDTEMSKEHCKLWRDARGDIWIQDLASTNGTKVNGEFLSPADTTCHVARQKSEARQLMVNDQVKLGLTTLALFYGNVEPKAPAAVTGDGTSGGSGES